MANSFAQPTSAPSTQPAAFQIIGQLDAPAINESSGVVMSRKYPGVFWTHNDSGNPSRLFAITREGKLIASFAIDAPNVDWEDIAIDDQGHLYLADIGNNTRNRWQVQVYRIPEPDPHARGQSRAVKSDRMWKLTFPDQPFDAEALCVFGESGYIIEKRFNGAPAAVYTFSLSPNDRPIDLKKVATLSQRVPVTGADISADGRWLAVMTIAGPAVYAMAPEISRDARFSAVFLDPSAESVCFVPGGLLATTEGRRVVFFPMPGLTQPQPTTRNE